MAATNRWSSLPLVTAVLALAGSTVLAAQESGPAHAPDFRALEKIAPLVFLPKPNAPFMAIARTTWVRTLPDGSTETHENQRVVARDMDGRTFQERRTFIPVPAVGNEQSEAYLLVYTDPVAHTATNCSVPAKTCRLMNSYEPMERRPEAPAGLQPDGTTYLTRENLGIDTYEGLEVQRSRETFTFFKQSAGNTKIILRVIDYWYSPVLGVNVKVVRHDPRDGDQTLWLTDISQTAADPTTFQIPSGYRVLDTLMQRPMYTGSAPH